MHTSFRRGDIVKASIARCINAGNGVGLRFPALLHCNPALPNAVGLGVGRPTCVKRQESTQKDVERAFGVLQGRWGLIQQPARAYEVNTLRRIMYAGIIMHNMILEDQNMSIVDLNHVYSNPARSMQTMWIDRCEPNVVKQKN
uniref:Putative nuclease HARBI1 n=1 Tax=Tanacetum cinerariifolium TaxID=118510 RepID=A0A6L2LHG7_TANCI|nr:putative nuclease HARBI1 [Tanacetum cinerariifolium]